MSAQFIFTLAILIQEVVLSFYLYEITHDPLALGLVGLAEAVPFISLALFGGYLADKYDRKLMYLLSFGVVSLVSIILIFSLSDIIGTQVAIKNQPYLIYISVLIFGIARGFYSPSWNSLKPFLVKSIHYSNSASWSAQFWQAGRIFGPVCGGFLYAYSGFINSLWVIFFLLVFTIFLASFISKKEITTKSSGSMIESLREGLHFVRSNKIMWYSIILDMFSVLFGGVIAILPVYAADILHVGAEGLGVLRAAPAVGAVVVMFGTAYFPPTNKPWRNMLLAVAGFGVATLVFGWSKNMYLSCIALFFTGAFDSISVVIRSTIMQIFPPENMRGRISAVNGVFVSTSNELGAFESGVAAKILGPVASVVFGGTMTLVIVAYIYSRSKKLFDVRLVKESN